jgi:hypothetical protein
MPRKNERRSQIDDLKTAYHVVDLVQQASSIRQGWASFKSGLFDFLIFVAAAGIVLLLGWWLH